MPARVAQESVEAAAREFASLPPDQPVRLAKRTSNLFRHGDARNGVREGLDLSAFRGVFGIDPDRRTARVGGLTTYEELVDALLPHGFVPLVVPQLRTITIGGAVTGLGIEASSFRNGLPHESVLEMRILTAGPDGRGEVVTATRDNDHADLFTTFPNSYGSLGYVLDLVIELEPASPYVALRHVRFDTVEATIDAIGTVMRDQAWDGHRVDFVDGVVFGPREAYLTLGHWTDRVEGQPTPSDYTGERIYYRSIQERRTDVLTAHDYLWRWDTDWFWCSEAFGAQHPVVRRLWPKSRLRSDVYWRIVAFEQRHGIVAAIDAKRGRLPRERVIQDVEIPLDHAAEFLDWFLETVPIEPIWLCPIQLRTTTRPSPTAPWPLYPMRPGHPYVNVGFWSSVETQPGTRHGDVNRAIEAKVTEFGGHKSLYSDAYYDEATFDRLYGGAAIAAAKRRYDPLGRFPTLYEKAVQAR
jgi:FAD/FMN-containing dehydrogenase